MTPYNPWLHRIALATAVATFPLIFMGGLVTSHGAGMSVPDWPNSYGYNMFTFPPSQWVGGIFYEHTHRLMGTVVGMLSIALTIAAWKLEPRTWARWLAYSVLGAVIFQGVLGGLRVVLVELDLAIVHACFAQAFFCLAALVCVVTSKWWLGMQQRGTGYQPVRNGIVSLAIICVVAIYLQLIVGATMRHYNAGLAIPDLPLHYGHWLPPTSQAALDAVNQQRAWEYQLPRVSMLQVWLHFGHRLGAIVVAVLSIILSLRSLRLDRRFGVARFAALPLLIVAEAVGIWAFSVAASAPMLSLLALAIAVLLSLVSISILWNQGSAVATPAILILALLFAQITLGVLTVLMRKPADIASLHVAVGALFLVTTFVLTVRAARLYGLPSKWHGLPARANGSNEMHGLVARATTAS